MMQFALKMLLGDRGKYIGIITGITLSSLIMIQQPGILISVLQRTYSFISDVTVADVWVMDPMVQFIDDAKPLQDTQLYRVRSVQGVEWAVPLYKGIQRVRLDNGEFVGCNMLGLDDATLIGGPPDIIEGKLTDLHRPDAVIVDEAGSKGRLAKPATTPGGEKVPLRVGDVLEINDKRAIVVGIARAAPTFQSQPIIYTTYSRAVGFALNERKLLSYILVKAKPGVPLDTLTARILKETGLAAYSSEQFKQKSLSYFLRETSILNIFGFMTFIGFVVGAAVTGQIFYNFTLDNLRHFGVFKAMGATDSTLLKMILLQALLVGSVGFGLGSGASAIFAALTRKNDLRIQLPWQLLAGSGAAILVICLIAALISIRKVIKLEPAVVFKG